MKEVKLNDKEFEIFIDSIEIDKIISQIADKINNSSIKDPLFIAILNGSFLFAADLIRKINIPNSEISFLKLASYDGLSTTGKVTELIGLSKEIKGRNIIEGDIIDTGITLKKLLNYLKRRGKNA